MLLRIKKSAFSATTPTPIAFASLRRSTLPTRGRVTAGRCRAASRNTEMCAFSSRKRGEVKTRESNSDLRVHRFRNPFEIRRCDLDHPEAKARAPVAVALREIERVQQRLDRRRLRDPVGDVAPERMKAFTH